MAALQQSGERLEAFRRNARNALSAGSDRFDRNRSERVIHVLDVGLSAADLCQQIKRKAVLSSGATDCQLLQDRPDIAFVRERDQNPNSGASAFDGFAEADKKGREVIREQVLVGRERYLVSLGAARKRGIPRGGVGYDLPASARR